MGKLIFFSFLILLMACQHPSAKQELLQARIDSLQHKLDQSYRPGLGEFMNAIQLHHAKLWFAGIHQNWPLADFEIHELGEVMEDIRQFNSDRPEVTRLSMIQPVLDSVVQAVNSKDETQFRRHFISLTATCNNCHQATAHGFNVVIIPDQPPVSNQDFSPQQ